MRGLDPLIHQKVSPRYSMACHVKPGNDEPRYGVGFGALPPALKTSAERPRSGAEFQSRASRRRGRPPMAGAPLRLGDLRHRHLEADGIAQAQVVVALAPSGPGGREVEPRVGRDVILSHALPPVVQEPEQLLRARIALLGGPLVPRA